MNKLNEIGQFWVSGALPGATGSSRRARKKLEGFGLKNKEKKETTKLTKEEELILKKKRKKNDKIKKNKKIKKKNKKNE